MEIYFSDKKKMLPLFVMRLLFAMSIVATIGVIFGERESIWDIFAVLAGIFIFGYFSFFSKESKFDKFEPVLVISKDGITYRMSSETFIPWAALDEVSTTRIRFAPIIVLTLTSDGADNLGLNKLVTLIRKLDPFSKRTLLVSTALLDRSRDEILNSIKEHALEARGDEIRFDI